MRKIAMLKLTSADKALFKEINKMEGLLYINDLKGRLGKNFDNDLEEMDKQLRELSSRLEKTIKTSLDVLSLFHICPNLIKSPIFEWLRDRLCLNAVMRTWDSKREKKYCEALDAAKSIFHTTKMTQPELPYIVAAHVNEYINEACKEWIVKKILYLYNIDDNEFDALVKQYKIELPNIDIELGNLRNKIDDFKIKIKVDQSVIKNIIEQRLHDILEILKEDRTGFWKKYFFVPKKDQRDFVSLAIKKVEAERGISARRVRDLRNEANKSWAIRRG